MTAPLTLAEFEGEARETMRQALSGTHPDCKVPIQGASQADHYAWVQWALLFPLILRLLAAERVAERERVAQAVGNAAKAAYEEASYRAAPESSQPAHDRTRGYAGFCRGTDPQNGRPT